MVTPCVSFPLRVWPLGWSGLGSANRTIFREDYLPRGHLDASSLSSSRYIAFGERLAVSGERLSSPVIAWLAGWFVGSLVGWLAGWLGYVGLHSCSRLGVHIRLWAVVFAFGRSFEACSSKLERSSEEARAFALYVRDFGPCHTSRVCRCIDIERLRHVILRVFAPYETWRLCYVYDIEPLLCKDIETFVPFRISSLSDV